jgi:hypothetical protein
MLKCCLYGVELLSREFANITLGRQEELLINTYAADGWKGANREKFKPTSEVQRAHVQVGPLNTNVNPSS